MFKWSNPVPHLFEAEFAEDLSLSEQEAFLQMLETLSAQTTPFVILMLSKGESPLNIENRKRMNFWFKNNRDWLNGNCFGMVRVQAGYTEDHYKGGNLEKAMPFPLFARADRAAGLELAISLLEGNAPKGAT